MLYIAGFGVGQIYRAIMNSKHWTVVIMPLVKNRKRCALTPTTTRELKVQFFLQCLYRATASRYPLTVCCHTAVSQSQHTHTMLRILRAFSSRTLLLHHHQLTLAHPMGLHNPSLPLPAPTQTAPMAYLLTRPLLHTCHLMKGDQTRMITAQLLWILIPHHVWYQIKSLLSKVVM